MTQNADSERRPLDVQQAADRSWRLGIAACRSIVEALLQTRRDLLDAGFPAAHALCEDIDRDAGKWAAIENRMRRDWLRDTPNDRSGVVS